MKVSPGGTIKKPEEMISFISQGKIFYVVFHSAGFN